MKLEPVAWKYRQRSAEYEILITRKQDHTDNLETWEEIPLYAIPEGYKVVPVEPTEAMIRAAYQSGKDTCSEIYKAMIAAGEQ